jgi:hypothetical protein
MREPLARIIDKFTSGKFIIANIIVITYCLSILGCLFLVIKKIIGADVFLGVFSGLSAVVITIKDSYFNKDKNQNGGAK